MSLHLCIKKGFEIFEAPEKWTSTKGFGIQHMILGTTATRGCLFCQPREIENEEPMMGRSLHLGNQ